MSEASSVILRFLTGLKQAFPSGENMRITIDLSEDLLNEAMKLTHTSTKTSVIVLALEELVRKSRIANLKAFKGKIDLDIDPNTLRNRN